MPPPPLRLAPTSPAAYDETDDDEVELSQEWASLVALGRPIGAAVGVDLDGEAILVRDFVDTVVVAAVALVVDEDANHPRRKKV